MATARGPYDPIVVGADIGNATTSVVTQPVQRAAFFPSFVATVGVGPYEGLSKIATSRHHLTVDGVNAIVGAEAFDGLGADSLLAEYGQADAWKRYTDPRSLYCLLAGISAAFVEADAIGVKLATGAPLSIFQTHAEEIKARFLGTHEYSYNGHTRKVIVRDVRVYGEGREVLRLLPEADRRGRVAVHDLGGRTWNVLLFKDGALIGAKTYDMGIDKLLGAIKVVSTDPGARWELRQEMRQSGKAHAPVRGELKKLLASALDVIERKIPLAGAERHALVGGGAFDLMPVLESRYKGAAVQILNGDAPEGANAAAYALAASETA